MPLHPTFARLLPTLPPRKRDGAGAALAPVRRSALARAQSRSGAARRRRGATVHVGGCRRSPLCQEGGLGLRLSDYAAQRAVLLLGAASPPPAPRAIRRRARGARRASRAGGPRRGLLGGRSPARARPALRLVRELRAADRRLPWCYSSGLSDLARLLRRLQAEASTSSASTAATGYESRGVARCATCERPPLSGDGEIPMLPGTSAGEGAAGRACLRGRRHLSSRGGAEARRSRRPLLRVPLGDVLHVHRRAPRRARRVAAAAARAPRSGPRSARSRARR
jgi:hypothetical protein